MINTILFDLDGTLLPMDFNQFVKVYFSEMAPVFADLIDPKLLVKYIWTATDIMVNNLEPRTNETVFMEKFATLIDGSIEPYMQRFTKYYDEGFLKVKETTYEAATMKKSVEILKQKGYQLIIATNPLFPEKAILHRIRWAGFQPEDFQYITSYERNHFCKPQVAFYQEILKEIGKTPEQCLMVGNDIQEDAIAEQIGIKTFITTDCLINRNTDEFKTSYSGMYIDFLDFVSKLPEVQS